MQPGDGIIDGNHSPVVKNVVDNYQKYVYPCTFLYQCDSYSLFIKIIIATLKERLIYFQVLKSVCNISMKWLIHLKI